MDIPFIGIYRIAVNLICRFSDEHKFVKPNDTRALDLMDRAAKDVMTEYKDIVLGFGESDEYRQVYKSQISLIQSFLLRRSTALYNRRQTKIVSTLTSYFTSCYVYHWNHYFPETPLRYPPSFDGRVVLYPLDKHVKDYFAWRQADSKYSSLKLV